MIRASFAVSASVLMLLACSNPSESLGPIPPTAPLLAPDQVMTVDATVRFSPIEGGCWLLVEAAGSRYVFNLPADFRREGLSVRATIRGTSWSSFCGPGVTVDTIRIR